MPSEYKPNFGVQEITAATLAVRTDAYAGVPIILSRAAGVTATLPAATGSGADFTFIVRTTVTSNGYIVRVANSTDVMVGNALLAQDAGDTAVMFEAGATADTVTLNGTTTGGLAGALVRVIDIASGLWWVDVRSAATGTEATPFSATV